MGTWTCPKCGSHDAYDGSTVVSEYRRGPSIGLENEFGVSMSQPVNDGTEHKLMDVVQCRKCDIILNPDKDYTKSSGEINDEHRAAEIKEFEDKNGCVPVGLGFLIFCFGVGVVRGEDRMFSGIGLGVCIIFLIINNMVENYRFRKKFGDRG